MFTEKLRSVLILGLLSLVLTALIFSLADFFRAQYPTAEQVTAELHFEATTEPLGKGAQVPQNARGYLIEAGVHRIRLPHTLIANAAIFSMDRTDLTSVALISGPLGEPQRREVIKRATPLNKRLFNDQKPAFRLQQNGGADILDYVLEVQTAYPVVLRLELWASEADYRIAQRISENVAWFYYGIILMLLLVNLFVYANSKIPAYLYYALFLFFHAVSISALEGLYVGTVLARLSYIHPLLIASIPLTVIFALRFLETFLELKEQAPRFYRFLRVLRVLFLILLVQLLLLPFPSLWALLINFQSILVIIASVIYPAVAGYLATSGKREYQVIFFAFIPHFVAVIYYALQVLGWMDYDPNYYYKLLGSSFAEMLLISLALGLFVRSMQAAKVASDRASIEHLTRAVRAEGKNAEELEAQVKERTAKLERATLEKNRLLETISHDLRSPLNSIVQYSELTLEATARNRTEDYLEFVKDINESSQSLFALLENLLTWTRTNWDGVIKVEAPVDLKRMLQSILKIYAVQIASRRIQIAPLPGDSPHILADENMLKVVLRNILSNALAYTPKDGTVTFAWDSEPGGDLLLRLINSGQPIQRSIADALSSGDPFAPETQQLSNGLGLRLCKATSDVNGWNFRITPLPDGTEVSIRLPLHRVGHENRGAHGTPAGT